MSEQQYLRAGNLFTHYARKVNAYRAAVHKLVESKGAEFKRARQEADRLRRECQTAHDELWRFTQPAGMRPEGMQKD
jgi:hypothetical protein